MPTGKNRVPMAQLRQVLSDAGFGRVRTWIQSGNVILQSDLAPKELEHRVHALIKEHIGPTLAIVARTADEIRQVIQGNPYLDGHDSARVFYVSFQEPPPADKVQALLAQDFSPEKLTVTENAAYMYIPAVYSSGKLSNNFLEKKLGVSATTRNYNTLSKLIELAEET